MSSPLWRRLGWTILADWLLVLAWMALIFYLSAQSTLPNLVGEGWLDSLLDYVAHAFVFGVLAALIWRASVHGERLRALHTRSSASSWAGALAALYGVSDEFHQSFVPGRHAGLDDWLADLIGILAALAVIRLGAQYLARRRPARLAARR